MYCRRVWGTEPETIAEDLALVRFGPLAVIFHQADTDAEITIGFASLDCDADFEHATARGAQVIARPADQPWGVRLAYLKGPGSIVFELEQQRPAGGWQYL